LAFFAGFVVSFIGVLSMSLWRYRHASHKAFARASPKLLDREARAAEVGRR